MPLKSSAARRAAVLPLALAALGACASGAVEQRDAAAAIAATINGLVEAQNTGDTEGSLAVHTADAVWMPPNQPAVQGIASLREFFDRLYATTALDLSLQATQPVVTGDWAYQECTFTETATPLDGGEARGTDEGQCLVIYRRLENDDWKIHRLIWNLIVEG